jgi:hypothetical protein
MRCLIRYISRKTKGGVTHEDKPFEGSVLTIGRGTDRVLFLADLRVALEHARITMGKDGKFVVHSDAVSGILVNERPVQTARLSTGDVVGIGSCRLSVVEPQQGYDLQLDVEVPKPGRDEAPSRLAQSKTSLADTRLSKRGWSWVLLLIVFSLFFVLPIAGFFVPQLQATLRAVPGLPSDAVWETGVLAKPHHFIGSDCNACHQKPFVTVRDEACSECHSTTAQHADPEFYALDALTSTRCGSCHKDHNGLDGLIRNDDALCSDCHADLTGALANIAETELGNAKDFRADHPQLKARFVRPSQEDPGGDEMSFERLQLDPGDWPAESSGLKFNHRVHLKEDGVKSPDGDVILECESCHMDEPGGAYMQPIKMVRMCKSCHELNFDATDPDREVPHGDMRAVIFTLKEYYAYRALQGGYDDPEVPEVVRRRRRPGERLTEEERKEALAWAEQKWRETAEDMIELRTCGMCHSATVVQEDPPRWKITPVRIAHQWMPKHHFSHIKHATEKCERCHDVGKFDTDQDQRQQALAVEDGEKPRCEDPERRIAPRDVRESQCSEDVLLPPKAVCDECHGGAHDKDLLASTCVDCHGFHIYQDALMSKLMASAPPEPTAEIKETSEQTGAQ